jgi:hypothetical protein
MSDIAAYCALASLFCAEVFVPIVCYADESGTHDQSGERPGSEVCVVAGLIAEKTQWDTFAVQWDAILNKYRVPGFHYSALLREQRNGENCELGDKCPSPHHGWLDDKYREFMYELAPVIRDNIQLGRAGLVDVKAYHKYVSQSDKDYFEHPYHAAFRLFFNHLMLSLRGKLFRLPANERIQFFFDQQNEFKKRAIQGYDEVLEDIDNSRYLGGFSFQSQDTCMPLQAADYVAGRIRKVYTRLFAGGKGITEGSWDDVLGRGGRITVGLMDEHEFKAWAKAQEER